MLMFEVTRILSAIEQGDPPRRQTAVLPLTLDEPYRLAAWAIGRCALWSRLLRLLIRCTGAEVLWLHQVTLFSASAPLEGMHNPG
jgi:hypothetical protein